MTIFNVQRAKNQKDLAQLASQIITENIVSVLNKKDRFQLALSGGSTPFDTYNLLKDVNLPWSCVDIFLGDERWVSPSDQSSNALMLKRTLLSGGPGSKACFYPIPTIELGSPENSANKFSDLIKEICIGNPPSFDLIVLGLGDDGHTASLFPGTQALRELDSYATVGRGKGQERVTLTANVISAASKIIFLVSGASKKFALKRLLDPNESFERTPAKLIKPSSEILILTDEEAAELI
ncbi:6-phosphogluconolactonase [Prochlorococcus marinus]|uniref:6-phosphogluconolactonase n=1 Tax=Prochlorococcus marinus TaxID=1219 RepID=UPI0022B54DE4|nr:6-phosphogluconolactonase [Prochlorococcus marinus]